jgi:hypothetical protein
MPLMPVAAKACFTLLETASRYFLAIKVIASDAPDPGSYEIMLKATWRYFRNIMVSFDGNASVTNVPLPH